MPIEPVSLADLGYRMMSPDAFIDPALRERLSVFARDRADYELISENSESWIRSPGRKSGRIPPCLIRRGHVASTSSAEQIWRALEVLNEPADTGWVRTQLHNSVGRL